MSENSLVSIIVNCFNGQKYLKDTLDSIISQTYNNWELIFWDNKSTDSSAQVFKKYKDKRFKYYLSNSHTSLNEARLNAIKEDKGDFFAFLDSDDLWLPNKLEKQLENFSSDIAFIYSNISYFNQKKEKIIHKTRQPEGFIHDNLLLNYSVPLQTVLFSTSKVRNLRTIIDTEFETIADFDLIMRLTKKYEAKYINEVLAKWRIHQDSLTWKDPYKTLNELRLWHDKQLKMDGINNKNSNYLKISKKRNFSRYARMLIMDGKKTEAFLMILKSAMWDWKWLGTLLLFFTPFSKKILQIKYNSNFK